MEKAPEILNLEAPGQITEIHAAYRKAGSHIVTTNTFGGNPFKLAEFGLQDKLKDINSAAVLAARRGGGADALVAGFRGTSGTADGAIGSRYLDRSRDGLS